MFEFVLNQLEMKNPISITEKNSLVLLLDIINNKEVQQHMTNVITYIIIISFLTFVNTFQAK